jgi:hypothetical protein
MKKLALLLLGLMAVGISPAGAATAVVRITDKPHTNFAGEFRDNELATLITPDGALGKIVFGSTNARKTWVIDPALVDEIADMSDGYSVQDKEDKAGQLAAQNWLSQLKYSTFNNAVIALPYGNPDQSLAKRLAPSELRFYSLYGKERLELQLGRTVTTQNGWGKGVSRLTSPLKSLYTENRQALSGLSTISSAGEITALRARLGTVMNPALDKDDREYFSYSAAIAVKSMTAKLRVIPGRYQLTSTTAKLPVTLVNSFDTPTVVSLSLIPMNSRIRIENVNNITLAAKSRQQLNLEVGVVASGNTIVKAQFMNSEGRLVGEQSELNLTATIIDSRVAWFTTAAAVLLFSGAVTQSVRRVRRSRK